jgi:hypothetical protein
MPREKGLSMPQEHLSLDRAVRSLMTGSADVTTKLVMLAPIRAYSHVKGHISSADVRPVIDAKKRLEMCS